MKSEILTFAYIGQIKNKCDIKLKITAKLFKYLMRLMRAAQQENHQHGPDETREKMKIKTIQSLRL